MRAPQRVLYVCLTAAKIVVRTVSHGFCHTGSFTLLRSVWVVSFCGNVPIIVLLMGFFFGLITIQCAVCGLSLFAHNT
jgi:ABC-type amino acid transport system permease subunit